MGTYRITSVLGWLLILATHYTVTLAAPSTGHGYGAKSMAQAYLECLQYLNISRQSMYAYDSAAVPSNTGGNCLLRCIGLNTRWWNDETGLNEKALVRFFRQTDPDALDQARTCLAKDSDPADTCAAAYRSFRCYSDALGEVIAHPEYVAPCREEIHRAVRDCAAMLQVSDEQLASCVGAETFQHSGNTTALLRCVVLRLGLYADTTGVMCDRLPLLMDSDTAQTWTEAHAEEAKRCENDLRELGADVCLVAAHSVEICYGWMAFGELWKVLREEYGSSNDVISYEHTEESVVESNEADEEAEKQQNYDAYPIPKEVEVFSYPSSTRYRSLLIVAPKWIAVDSTSDSSDTSSSLEETTPSDDKLATHELSESFDEKPTNSDNTVKQETVSESEEKQQPETEHIVHTRSVMYPMAPEAFPYCRQVLPPYALRMRRSIPLPHYHPHAMSVTGAHYYHPMSHPIVKRSIPMDRMYVPAYRPFVPARFVRDVDSTVSHVALSDDPVVDLSELSGSQNEFVSDLVDEDSTVSRNEELGVETSRDGEDVVEDRTHEEPVVPTLNEESSEPVVDEALNEEGDAQEETVPVSPSNVVDDPNNGETANDDDLYQNENSDVTSDNSALPPTEDGTPEETEATSSEQEIPQDPNSSSVSTDNSVQPSVVTDQPKPSIHPHTVHRLIREATATNLIKNLLSALTTR